MLYLFIYLFSFSTSRSNSLIDRRLQNNKLSGTLDVLQDLPLRDLYVSNHFHFVLHKVLVFGESYIGFTCLLGYKFVVF